MLSSEELHRRGLEAINAGRIAHGRALLERALARAAGDEAAARAEASLAYVMAERGDRPGALARCDEALGRSGISSATRGLLHGQRGLLHMLGGRSAEALSDFGAAVENPDLEDAALGRAHLNRGGVYLQQLRAALAEQDFRAAVPALERAGLAVESAMAAHNLGYCRLLGGDLVDALDGMDRAREVLAPLSAVSEATCDQDRAEALMAAGLVEEGRRALAGAARAYGSRRLRRRQAECELTLARTLVLDDPVQAAAVASRSIRHFRAADADAWCHRGEAVRLAAEVDRGRHGPSLVARGRALEETLRQLDLPWEAAAVRLQVARMQTRRGDLEAAADLVRIPGEPDAPRAVRLLGHDVRAELAAARGDHAAALGHVRAGLADLHAWQSSFGSLDLQTMVVGHGTRLGGRGLALAVSTGDPGVLFEWSERARMLASRVQPVRAPADPALVDDLVELRLLDGPGATAREGELRRRVREGAWRRRGSGEVVDPIPLPELQAGLGAGRALVAHVVTASRVVALVVTDSSATCHDLGPRAALDALLGGLLPDLDIASTDLPGPMAVLVRRGLAARLDDLAALLVTPALAAIGDRQLVLTPSGVLAGVPWTLLPGLVGRPLTLAQSATSWVVRQEGPLRTSTAGFVAGPDVARADDEVIGAARRWADPVVLVGPAATAAAVSGLAEQVDVLHVAAHGQHVPDNPMFSGLRLRDGAWFGYDIDQLRAVPDVVVLSACDVGRSSVRAGEELIGMTATWLHAGARCVVAATSAVSDEVAHDVLLRLHDGLATGLDPAVALARAVPPVGEGRAPAPFMCFG